MAETLLFDEQAYLRLLERMSTDVERAGQCNAQDLARLLHLSPRLVCELIRLRELAHSATLRASLLEQGQQVLALRAELIESAAMVEQRCPGSLSKPNQ